MENRFRQPFTVSGRERYVHESIGNIGQSHQPNAIDASWLIVYSYGYVAVKLGDCTPGTAVGAPEGWESR